MIDRHIAITRLARARVHCNAQLEILKNAEPASDGARHIVKIKTQTHTEILAILDGETP